MTTIITFSKLKKRTERAVTLPESVDERHRIVLSGDGEEAGYEVTYEFQCFDKKKRPVYTEVTKKLIEKDQ